VRKKFYYIKPRLGEILPFRQLFEDMGFILKTVTQNESLLATFLLRIFYNFHLNKLIQIMICCGYFTILKFRKWFEVFLTFKLSFDLKYLAFLAQQLFWLLFQKLR
jgi:hypothetical protein